MLKSFSVSGYRSFQDKVTLDLGKPHDYSWHNDPMPGDGYVTNGIISNALIIGEKATGKTNLGHALMDVQDNFTRNSARFDLGDNEDSSYLNGDSECGYAVFEYRFAIGGTDVLYAYRKDGHRKVLFERLALDGRTVFAYDSAHRSLEGTDLETLGANNLNWDFADDEMSVLGYLSNSLPKTESPVIFALRRFIDRMGMTSVSTRTTRYAMINSALRPILRSEELVGRFERFLREYGVDERLQVVDGPDGSPALYFRHRRLVPFAQACSSGTLMLLLLFSRFVLREDSLASLMYIDEFDADLHYKAAERLVSYFGSVGTCQTVCTTHNTSSVRNATMRPDCVFEITRVPLAERGEVGAGLHIEALANKARLGETVRGHHHGLEREEHEVAQARLGG